MKAFEVEWIDETPAMWEQGGGYSNTGEAVIVASPKGEPLQPLQIVKKGPKAN